MPYFLSLLARAHARNRQTGAALETLAEARERAEQTGERIWEAELHRLEGVLALEAASAPPPPGAVERAEKCLAQARAVAQRQGARSLELRAAMSLARLRRLQGDAGAAGRELREVYQTFTEGFDTADLKQARALLATLAAR